MVLYHVSATTILHLNFAQLILRLVVRNRENGGILLAALYSGGNPFSACFQRNSFLAPVPKYSNENMNWNQVILGGRRHCAAIDSCGSRKEVCGVMQFVSVKARPNLMVILVVVGPPPRSASKAIAEKKVR